MRLGVRPIGPGGVATCPERIVGCAITGSRVPGGEAVYCCVGDPWASDCGAGGLRGFHVSGLRGPYGTLVGTVSLYDE